MNEKEIAEIRRRFRPDKSNITHIRGCYVNDKREIVTGIEGAPALETGSETVRSVRLAAEAGVNPNTMQRAITQLETLGLVTTNRTLGRTVTENAGALEEMRRRLAVECTENFFKEMGALGYSRGEAADMAQAERKKNDE